MKSPIVQEVRATREALAEKFDFDLHRICEDAMKRQAAEKTVNRAAGPKKQIKATGKETPKSKRKPGDR